MKNLVYVLLLLSFLIISCSNKKASKNDNFPVLSFIKSQVAHIDTSLYQIIKVVTVDSTHDTTYIRREDFRKEAEDFLSLPDLADDAFNDKYSESKLYDETLDKVIISYLPVKDDNLAIQREEVLIQPGINNDDKVKSLIIDFRTENKDSSVIKKLLWQVDQSFQVVTSVQKNDQPEKISTLEVTWK